MDDLTSSPNPYADRGENVFHFARQAEVIFVKKVRTTVEPGASGEAPTVDFHNKYHEFITNGILVQNKALAIRDAYTNPNLYEYWQVTTSNVGAPTIVTGGTTNLSNVSGTNTLVPNADVSEIHVNQTVRGMSTASVTLRSPLDKYLFQNNPIYAGQSLFESDDLVYINLPGLDGNLYRRFTGLVSTVSTTIVATGETFLNSVIIECDDMLKLLVQTRIASQVSVNEAEARKSFSPLVVPYSDQLPHEILTQIFARALCDFSTAPLFTQQLQHIRATAASDPNGAALAEEDLLRQISKLPSSNASGNVVVGPTLNSSLFIVPVGTVTESTATFADESATTLNTVTTTIPRQIFGYTNARSPVTMSTIDQSVSLASPVPSAGNFPADTLAFLIEGTAQPAWSIAFASASVSTLFISEWKNAFDVAMGIAKDIEFELFTTPEGIVRFRPFNATLPADTSPPKYTADLPVNVYPRVGYEYWLQPQFIKNSTLKNTDHDVFTIAYVLGLYQISNLNSAQLQYLRPGIAVDSIKFANLGARVAPQKNKIGLVTEAACQAYAVSYLSRLNARARSGTLDYIGDARIQAGNPVYIPNSNQIHYLESLTDTYIAGKGYTMGMNLTYGRVPFALTDSKANQLAATTSDAYLANLLKTYYTFNVTLNRLIDSGVLTKDLVYQGGVGANSTLTELTRYEKYGPSVFVDNVASTPSTGSFVTTSSPLSLNAFSPTTSVGTTNVGGDGSLVFNGYVWEDIPVMTYEDITEDTQISGPAISLAKILSDQRNQSAVFFEKVQAVMRQNPTYTPAKAVQAAIQKDVDKVQKHG